MFCKKGAFLSDQIYEVIIAISVLVGVDVHVFNVAMQIHRWAATWQNQQNGYAPSEDSYQSGSSLCAQWVAKNPNFLHADSENSDQTGRMPRLIWVFAGPTATLLVLSCHGSGDYISMKSKRSLRRKEAIINIDGALTKDLISNKLLLFSKKFNCHRLIAHHPVLCVHHKELKTVIIRRTIILGNI